MQILHSLSALLASHTAMSAKPSRADAHDIAKAVAHHCRIVGCDESNTIAAVAWALKEPGCTLAAIRAGNRRADQLRLRQQRDNSPPLIA